jgi:hypothetical protein
MAAVAVPEYRYALALVVLDPGADGEAGAGGRAGREPWRVAADRPQ